MGSAASVDAGFEDQILGSTEKDLDAIILQLPKEARSKLLHYVKCRAAEAASLSDPKRLLVERQFGFDTYQLSENLWKGFLSESERDKETSCFLQPGECKVTRFEYEWDLDGGHCGRSSKFSSVLRGCLESNDIWEYSICNKFDPGDNTVEDSAASLLLVTSAGVLRISEAHWQDYHDTDIDKQLVTTFSFCEQDLRASKKEHGNDTDNDNDRASAVSLTGFHDLRLFDERTKDDPAETNEARLINADAADSPATWQHLYSSASSYLEHDSEGEEKKWEKEVGSVRNMTRILAKLSGKVVQRGFDDCSTDEQVKTAALAAFLKGFRWQSFPCSDVQAQLAVVRRQDSVGKTSLRKEPSNLKTEEVLVHPSIRDGTEVEAKVFQQCPAWAFVLPMGSPEGKGTPEKRLQGWIKLKNLKFKE